MCIYIKRQREGERERERQRERAYDHILKKIV